MDGESFNNPFSGLKKDLKGRKKAPLSAPAPKKAPPPPELSQDFTGDDEAASAMFLAALGQEPARKKSGGAGGIQSMAGLLAEQAEPMPEAAALKAPEKAASRQHRPEKIPGIKLSDDEAQSFAQAMQGVTPVNGVKGRDLAPPVPAAPVRHKSAERDYLAEFTEGKYEFALEYTEEFFEGHVMGLDPLINAKLRAGSYSPEAHIDLHGLNSDQAYAALADFIKAAYIQSRRHLVVVTGRGKNSPGGLSVLRQNMQEWLTKEPLRRVVLAFCTAQPKDGGAGALYVLLRKYKKNHGKVRWDITPPGV